MKEKREPILIKGLGLVISIVALLALLFANAAVVARFLEKPSPWSDELLKAIFIWIFFVGGALAYRDKALIGITMLEEKLNVKKGPKAFATLKLIQTLVVSGFAIFCAVQGIIMMLNQIQVDETTPVLQFPTALITLGFVVGCILWSAFTLQDIWNWIKALPNNLPTGEDTPPAQS